jgi:hypothetical protein
MIYSCQVNNNHKHSYEPLNVKSAPKWSDKAKGMLVETYKRMATDSEYPRTGVISEGRGG